MVVVVGIILDTGRSHEFLIETIYLFGPADWGPSVAKLTLIRIKSNGALGVVILEAFGLGEAKR